MEGGGIGLDRWEAEVQQHQDYLDKMARVKERREANLKKLEQAGLEETNFLKELEEEIFTLTSKKERLTKKLGLFYSLNKLLK